MQPLPTDAFPPEMLEKEFFPIVSAMKRDGKYYGVPTAVRSLALFYNKKLFEQAGLDPAKPPTTWEQFRADADRLTNVDPSGKITQMGILPTFGGSDFVGTWLPVYMAAFGGRLIDASGKKLSTDCAACLPCPAPDG